MVDDTKKKKGRLKGLTALRRKVKKRFSVQPKQIDLLPDKDEDLEHWCSEMITDVLPYNDRDKDRRDILHHARNLEILFEDKPKIVFLNALCISYLRRETPHTEKAKHLFFRIWSERGTYVLRHTNMRWCISTLQTFYDHSDCPKQRLIGSTGMVYANLIKLYETERRWEKHGDQNLYQIEPGDQPRLLPGHDLPKNLNALVYDVAENDPVAGAVLKKVMFQIRRGKNVFQRIDDFTDAELDKEAPLVKNPSFAF